MVATVRPAPRPGAAPAARIREAARRRLFAFGYNALTMDDLAHDLGMSKKTLYRHYPGKEAIVAAIIDGLGRALRRELDEILADPRRPFLPKLRAVIDAVAARLGLLSPAMLRELQRFAPRIHDRIDELRQRNIPSVFGRLFRAGLSEGAMRPGLDPDFAARFWLHAVRGLLHPEALAATPLTAAQTLTQALDLFAGGLLSPAGRKDYEKLFPR